jgi:hypothetical protein
MSRALPPQIGCRVRRLRLQAKSESDARRASIVLSDALHIASLPAVSSGQMLVVRRLPLGRVPADASAATLALIVEQTMRKLRTQAVPFDSPAAQEANAVLFPGQVEAIARLARLHARAVLLDEWYWKAVLPTWRTGLSRGERWLTLLQAAHDLPEATLAVVAIVEEALQAGVEKELLCALPPGRCRTWLQLAGWNTAESAQLSPPLIFNAQHEDVLVQWARRWGPASQRLVWLAVILATAEKPARIADRSLPARAETWLNGTRKNTCGSRSERTKLQTERAGLDGESLFAGLLFLIPILERLGFDEALVAQPALTEVDFPARLLRFIGSRVGLPAEDPLALGFADFDPGAALPNEWEMPEAARRELAFPVPRQHLNSPLLAWLTATRRWCRRRARIGLVSLICRPGKVVVSRTHLEISFDLRAVDIRLRRLALDVDPGWVRWLGRVVQFHYGEADE